MARMDELWRAVGGPGQVPAANPRAVRARVNAALNADLTERRLYMKQKIRSALAAAALAAILTISALAAGSQWDALSAFFKGDTSPAQEYLDNTPRSASDENYTLTVESSVSDKTSACLLLTVRARNEETKKFLFSDDFVGIDTFDTWAVSPPPGSEADDPVLQHIGSTYYIRAQTEDSLTFAMRFFFAPSTTALRVRIGYMEEDAYVEAPLTPAPTVTLDVNATGPGVPWMGSGTVGELTIRQIHLSPLTCRVEAVDPASVRGDTHPRLLFRMADGTIRTQAQTMDFTGGELTDRESGTYTFDYVLREVLDLSQVQSVLLFDTEYPLDGSKPKAVTHDPLLDPFEIPMTDQLLARLSETGGFPIPVRALTEGLGGTCQWDPQSNSVTCTYRGVSVVLTPGSNVFTVDGVAQERKEAPQVRYITDDGSGGSWVTVAPWYVFEEAWSLDSLVTYTEGEPVPRADGSFEIPCDYHSWYVIP